MGSPKKIKAAQVDRFQKEVSEAKAVVLAEYKGLTVQELEELRKKLRLAGGHVRIIKNTLARVALHNLGIHDLDGDLSGQVAFVFSNRDAVAGTKAVSDFAGEKQAFVIRSGWFEGRRLSLEEVKSLANLPSREELQARFVGLLCAPLTDFVVTLRAVLSEFIGTLDARAAKMQSAEG